MYGESAIRTCNSRTSWLGCGFPDRAERALVTALTPHRVQCAKGAPATMGATLRELIRPAAGAGRGTMSATWSGTFAVASAAEAAYRPANLAHETSANLVGPCRISTIVEWGEVANVIERSIVPSVRMSAWRNFPIMSPFELPHG